MLFDIPGFLRGIGFIVLAIGVYGIGEMLWTIEQTRGEVTTMNPRMTLRGMALLRAATVVLYAGSLIPEAVIAEADKSARVVDTAPLILDEIIALMETAHAAGQDVARLHSGDPSLYGAIAEQIRRLDALGIGYDITPGVPAYAAAAAALGCELTLPGIVQSVILTRTSGPLRP